jgi:hypothetical protein
MRHPLTKLSFLVILLYLTACTKTTDIKTTAYTGTDTILSSTGNEQAPIPPGAWNLISDSTFEGVGLGNRPVDSTGLSGDYFSFSTDGYVYTKEGNLLDTLTYQMVSDSTVIISHFGIIINGIPDTCTITGLGANSLTGSNDSGQTPETIVIESPFFLTPGGEFWRKVTLSR